MTSNPLRVLLSLICVLSVNDPARADFTSFPFNPIGTDYVVSDVNPDGPTSQAVADQFSLSQNYTPFSNQALKITWWGGLLAPASPLNQTLDFNIAVYAGAFIPNELPVAAGSVPVTVTGTPVVATDARYNVFQYEATIHIGSALSTNQGYWLSIVDVDPQTGQGGLADRWHWAATDLLAGGYARRIDIFDGWQNITQYPFSPPQPAYSRAFRIEVVDVPEPAWLAGLVIAASIGWTLLRRWMPLRQPLRWCRTQC